MYRCNDCKHCMSAWQSDNWFWGITAQKGVLMSARAADSWILLVFTVQHSSTQHQHLSASIWWVWQSAPGLYLLCPHGSIHTLTSVWLSVLSLSLLRMLQSAPASVGVSKLHHFTFFGLVLMPIFTSLCFWFAGVIIEGKHILNSRSSTLVYFPYFWYSASMFYSVIVQPVLCTQKKSWVFPLLQ